MIKGSADVSSRTKSSFIVMTFIMACINLRPSIASVGPILKSINHSLQMSSSISSLLTSIPVFCMGAFSPFAVKARQIFGNARAIWLSLFLIGFSTLLRLVTMSSDFLLLTALLVGVGIGLSGPLLSGFVKQHFPKHTSVMIGLYSVMMAMGAAISSGFTPLIQAAAHGSWRMALASWTILALIVLPVWWFVIVRHESKPLREEQHMNKSSRGLPLKSKRAWIFTLFFGVASTVFYTLMAWIAPILVDMGYSKNYAASILTLFNLVQIPASLFMPMLIKNLLNRLFWLLLGSFMEITGLLILAFTSISPVIAAILMGLGVGGLFSLALFLPIDEVDDPDEANSWAAMTQSGGYIIASFGPFIIGSILDVTKSTHSALYALIIVGIILVAIQITIVFTKKEEKKRSLLINAK